MRTDAFDFALPDDLIALRPPPSRDGGRLLIVQPNAERNFMLRDSRITALPDELRAGDALVFNDTKVLAAFLKGERIRDGSRVAVSINLLSRLSATTWSALAKPARRLKAGDLLRFAPDDGDALTGRIVETYEGGRIDVAFDGDVQSLDETINRVGLMPLPHYIAARRTPDADDRSAYQTVFAKHAGAVAAPTAGLHFTPELLDAIADKGVSVHHLTLHVGGGTFLPVKAEDTRDHIMHSEWGTISAETAAALNAVKARGGRIIAVGTTSLRLLESAANSSGDLQPFRGNTDIFITPGYWFKFADRLLTNFHLPKSTLFMLVSAFSGLETMKSAYAHAIQMRYRFYSYGDACLLDRVDSRD